MALLLVAQDMTGSGTASTLQPSLRLAPGLATAVSWSRARLGGNTTCRGRVVSDDMLWPCPHLEADPVADCRRHPVAGDAEVGAAVPPGHAGQADHLPHHHRGVLAWPR